MAEKILEPVTKDGKTVCPKCYTQKRVKILDYGLKGEGKIFFLYFCQNCKVNFQAVKNIADM